VEETKRLRRTRRPGRIHRHLTSPGHRSSARGEGRAEGGGGGQHREPTEIWVGGGGRGRDERRGEVLRARQLFGEEWEGEEGAAAVAVGGEGEVGLVLGWLGGGACLYRRRDFGPAV
jgi:hypothetical protein